MEFFKIRRTIPFMRHAKVFNIISALTFLAAVVLLATRGLHFSIEFTGGTVMQVSYANAAEPEKIRESLRTIGLNDVSVQNFGTSRDVLIRLGDEALSEHADWLLLHRDRPIELPKLEL